MTDLMERKQDELDRLTVAIANGYALAMSPEAQAEWRRRQAEPVADTDAAARQSATVAKLSRLFPGMVKRRTN